MSEREEDKSELSSVCVPRGIEEEKSNHEFRAQTFRLSRWPAQLRGGEMAEGGGGCRCGRRGRVGQLKGGEWGQGR